jgi:hypothetical protein
MRAVNQGECVVKRLVLVFAILMTTSIMAQEMPAAAVSNANVAKTPTLTETQILQVQNAAQRIELAQQRARAAALEQQLAGVEFERAREVATKLVQTLQVQGYDLDLERFVYVPKVATDKPMKTDAAQPGQK